MQFYKYFLMGFILLLSFSEKGLTMEDDHPDSNSILRTESLPNLPVEIQAHILSFLEHQNDLLRAGGTSKTWRQAAEMVWENKPLDLSKRRLNQEDYKALIHGSFSFLVLQSVHLGKEEACILALPSRVFIQETAKRSRIASKLKYLDLGSNSIGAEGVGKIAAGNLSALTALYLSYNSIGAEGAGKIASGNLSALTALDLSNNSIGAEGAGKIASGNLHALTALDLSGNSIGEEGAGKIASGNLHALTTLHLSRNSIGDEGAGKIASGNLSALTALYLSYNSIGAEGAGKIASGNLSALTTLYLSYNSVGAEGVGKIASGNLGYQ